MAGSALQLAVDEPSKKCGHPLSLITFLQTPRLDRQQKVRTEQLFFIYFCYCSYSSLWNPQHASKIQNATKWHDKSTKYAYFLGVYIYIYNVCIYIYIDIYIWRKRDRERFLLHILKNETNILSCLTAQNCTTKTTIALASLNINTNWCTPASVYIEQNLLGALVKT